VAIGLAVAIVPLGLLLFASVRDAVTSTPPLAFGPLLLAGAGAALLARGFLLRRTRTVKFDWVQDFALWPVTITSSPKSKPFVDSGFAICPNCRAGLRQIGPPSGFFVGRPPLRWACELCNFRGPPNHSGSAVQFNHTSIRGMLDGGQSLVQVREFAQARVARFLKELEGYVPDTWFGIPP
jgi:hypothetical protein